MCGAAGASNILINYFAFGSFFGPHIAFAGGVAAAAYAKKKGVSENGADIVSALAGLNEPDVLLVGGKLKTGSEFMSKGKTFTTTLVIAFSYSLVVASVYAAAVGAGVPVEDFGGLYHVLIFGLAAVGLTFAVAGQAFFGCHHIVIIAAEAAVQSYATTGNAYMALAMGVIFGTISGLLGDIAGASINSGTDSHIDPPATAIFIMTFVVNAIFPVL